MKRFYRLLSIVALISVSLSACGGGGGGGSTTPPVTITPTPNPGPSTQNLACPTSGSSAASVASSSGTGTFAVARRGFSNASTGEFVPGTIAVTFAGSARADAADSIEGELRASRMGELSFGALGVRTRVISVDPANVDKAVARLSSAPGVQSVSRIAYRQRLSVSANDPFYVGFGGSAPYFQTSSEEGQWDMHVMNVQGAWNEVSASGPVTGANIAIVDTGVDITHPELGGGKIVRTQCFVTYPSSASQTTSSFVTDTDGHGTDVAGIADANSNNGLGFASPAFGAHILAYRIFPTEPTGGCSGQNQPAQCESNTFDEATAINDAVANGAKVINLSLGASGPCSSNDPEYKAVENAIAHNVVVVAAAGNETKSSLDCPAADPGVIAVGASSLDDSVLPIKEVVASYSNYVSGTNGGHYVVAPGGDPSSADTTGTTTDYLHWITNIYSSTAVKPGTCKPDPGSTNGTNDCRILIAGTSQATPHVVGVASLILAVRPNYTPAQVAAALCNSATNIGDSKQGCGRVDAAAAVTYAKSH